MDRVEELLLDHALWGLSAEEERELQELADRQGRAEDLPSLRESFELAGASTITALLPEAEPMPLHVMDRIRGHADRFLSESESQSDQALPNLRDRARGNDRPTERGWVPWVTALASAAVIVLAFESDWFRNQLNTDPEKPSVVVLDSLAARDLFARYEADQSVENIDWVNDSANKAQGQVLWNSDNQDGVLRMTGLKANDPTKSRYQLWIFDDTRTHEGRHLYPVDGGVFDVAEGESGVEEAFVRFSSRLPVGDAFAFVVTEEEPSGVVVSDRSRIVWAAGSVDKIR